MKKCFVLLTILLLVVGCSNTSIPLPPGTSQSKSSCPEEILHLGGTCYSVPHSHNETITWYEDKSIEEGWTFNSTTDDEPYSYVFITKDKKAIITFYRQSEDEHTGLLMKMD
ncbi:hypothetical protein PCCS19_21950 [Paenibacillus sp. CCS19]|nr:hypothetical protein PCCS19_21950 [Paenibacillus cellulosilyticus]